MVDVTTFIEVAVDGLAQGLFLTLLGVGITLVFGLGEVLNLAIGTFAIGSILVATTVVGAGFGLPVAVLVAVLTVGVFSLAVDQLLLEHVYRSEGEERILLGIFVTLGVAISLDGVLNQFYPSRYSLSLQLPTLRVGGATIVASSIVVIAVSLLLLVVLFAFLRGTFLGRATRTVFQDEVGARLVGVDPRRVRTLVFVLSSVVAAIAGLAFGIGATVSVSNAFEFTIFALIVSIVGGVRSIEGAAVSGVVLGFVLTFANFFIGSFVATMILFIAAIAVLLVNPEVIRG